MKFCGECGNSRSAMPAAAGSIAGPPLVHPEAPRREDPHLPHRPRRRAQAGDRPLRRREGLDGAGRAARSGRVAQDPRPLLPDPHRRRAPLRGHGESVHRRRHHGAVRRADRARGPRAARLLRGAPSARRRSAPMPTSAAYAMASSFAARMGLNSGEVVVGTDRRRSAHGLHGAGAHRRSGAAHGAARRARQRIPDGAHRAPRRGLLRAPRPREVRAQGRAASRSASTRSRGSGRCATRFDLSRARGFSKFVGRAAEHGDPRGRARAQP